MITILMWIFTGLLVVFSLLDIKSKAIPSVLLTGTILVITALNFENLKWAILMGIIGWMLFEFAEGNKVSFGIADIKIMIMLGFFISTLSSFMTVALAFATGQVFYISALRKILNSDEIPFVPFFLLLWIAGLSVAILGAGSIWA